VPEAFFFRVDGTPRPQPRPRKVKGRFVSTVDPKAKLWRTAVTQACRAAIADSRRPRPLFAGPIRLAIVFTFRPPSSAPERIGTPHTLKPDASNLLKLVEDVMEECGVYRNDCEIAAPAPEKWWGRRPGVAVTVAQIATSQRQSVDYGSRQPPDWLRR
jgi:Holliday junction resolvase RusA-like endonuclease